MQQTYLKHKNLYWAILVALGLPSMAIATPTNNPPLTLNHLSGGQQDCTCLLYTSPSPRDLSTSRMPSSA